jgi:hypothetical protein
MTSEFLTEDKPIWRRAAFVFPAVVLALLASVVAYAYVSSSGRGSGDTPSGLCKAESYSTGRGDVQFAYGYMCTLKDLLQAVYPDREAPSDKDVKQAAERFASTNPGRVFLASRALNTWGDLWEKTWEEWHSLEDRDIFVYTVAVDNLEATFNAYAELVTYKGYGGPSDADLVQWYRDGAEEGLISEGIAPLMEAMPDNWFAINGLLCPTRLRDVTSPLVWPLTASLYEDADYAVGTPGQCIVAMERTLMIRSTDDPDALLSLVRDDTFPADTVW